MNNKTTTVYKVTTGNRKSIISDWHNDPMEQELINALVINYPTLKWVYPRMEGAYILAFKTLEAAQKFVKTEIAYKSYCCDYSNGLIIWECKSDKLIEWEKRCNDLPTLSCLEIYKEKLKNIINKTINDSWNPFPAETIYCERIRLAKKLETHNYTEEIAKRKV